MSCCDHTGRHTMANATLKPLQVGLLGLGTVGFGTWTVQSRNEEEITRRAGRPIRITWIAERDQERARESTRGADVTLTADAAAVLGHPDIDIVIELIGGIEPARTFILKAIANGKHVVTANKALLARHGNEIFAAAHAKGVMVAFEGAVAGGIPIIKALREGLTANRIEWIAGIINGTSNFILSEMRGKGAPFDAVLVKGDAVGATLYYGPGAGAEPTASAVIADLVDVTRMHTADPEHRVPHLAFQPDQLSDIPFLPMGEVVTSYYLRMRVLDRPGVLADIARILADRGISIEAMIQKEPPEGEERTDIILLTHKSIERQVVDAIAKIEALATVKGKVVRIRMEELN